MKLKTHSKLTLWIPEDVKRFGKNWSRRHDESLSQLLIKYLRSLKEKEEHSADLSPLVKTLKGRVLKHNLSKKDYKKHLEEKYL